MSVAYPAYMRTSSAVVDLYHEVVRSCEIPDAVVLRPTQPRQCRYCGRKWNSEKYDSCPGCGAHDDA